MAPNGFSSTRPWTEVTRQGGHPGISPSEQWATRRWTAPSDKTGDLVIEYELANAEQGAAPLCLLSTTAR